MIKVYSTSEYIEAHMIASALEAEGISVTVHGDTLTIEGGQEIAVWIQDPRDERRAKRIIDEILSKQRTAEDEEAKPPVEKRTESPLLFYIGLFIGIVVGVAAYSVYEKYYAQKQLPTSWDRNGDGMVDSWAEYSDNFVSKQIYDLNFDGKPDVWDSFQNALLSHSEVDRNYDGKPDHWRYYDPPGNLVQAEYDSDSDEKADYTEFVKNNCPYEYSADNDRDGRIDTWGLIEEGKVSECNWSFQNDKTVDKKAWYRNGRKVREAYDRDRDGQFDEVIHLDEFERVVKVESKTSKGE